MNDSLAVIEPCLESERRPPGTVRSMIRRQAVYPCVGRKDTGRYCASVVQAPGATCAKCLTSSVARFGLTDDVETLGEYVLRVLSLDTETQSSVSQGSGTVWEVKRPEDLTGIERLAEELLGTVGESAELAALAEKAASYATGFLAPSTKESYKRWWLDFLAFGDRHQIPTFPSTPGVVLLYLAHTATRERRDSRGSKPLSHASLQMARAAIRRFHEAAGEDDPTDHSLIDHFLAGHGREHGVVGEGGVDPLDMERLERICAQIDSAIAEHRRDAVLVLLASDPALNLGAAQLAKLSSWVNIDLPVEPGKPAVLWVTRGTSGKGLIALEVWPAEAGDPCPVAELEAWYREREGADPVFPNQIDGRQMSKQGVAKLVKARIEQSGVGDHWPVVNGIPRLPRHARKELYEGIASPADIDIRDKAVLLNQYFILARGKEMEAFAVRDATVQDNGVVWHFDRSKKDQMGKGADIGAPAFTARPDLCPRRAYLAWLVRLERLHGKPLTGKEPAFPSLHRASDLVTAMSRDAISRMVKRRTAAAGLTGRFASHSLRKGFVEDAIGLDIAREKIAAQGRWADVKSVDDYFSGAGPLGRSNPGEAVQALAKSKEERATDAGAGKEEAHTGPGRR